ncbi:hypothetical protein ABT143_10050 [Streptomyces sp. NPDC002033]|uniref:hypothetical protein n=1 Tax=unclassified Streptomyces TaxID=2593676 RepID=UPI00332C2C74
MPEAAEFAHPAAAFETAAELAERGRRVALVCGGVRGPARPRPALGVTLTEGPGAEATAVHP